MKQSHSTTFVVKVKLNDDEIENVSLFPLITFVPIVNPLKSFQGDIVNTQHCDPDGKILLSELFSKLNYLKNSQNILYTVSECLLDRIFDSILESDAKTRKGFVNSAFNRTSETPT